MTKSKLTALISGGLLIAGAVTYAIVSPQKATQANAVSTANTFTDSLKATLHKRSMPNSKTQAKEDSIVDLAMANMTKGFATPGIYDTMVIIKPPVVINPGGTVSGPVTLVSGKTYSGLTIDLKNAKTIGISGNKVSNVTIINCKIVNTTSFAINLSNCTNITVQNCFFSNVGMGVYASSGTGYKINNNQFLNINGIDQNWFGHAIQLNGVSGGGNVISGNHIENIAGVALHPHDLISIYQSNGIKGDSIMVMNNWIRGGQLSKWPTANAGACGIVLCDVNGTYQVARGNILVNPGAGGVAIIGTGVGIKADHNKIFSVKTPVTGQGMGVQSKSQTDVGFNNTNWTNSNGDNSINSTPLSQFWLANSPMPLNWKTNTWSDKTITTNILPSVIITYK
jgi:hypothetical protein